MSRRKIGEISRKATPSGMSIVKRIRTDEVPVEKIVSETDDQVHRLYDRQTETDVSLESVRDKFKEFSQPAVYKPLLSGVRGKKSLGTYRNHMEIEDQVQELRDCGLNEEEITLWLNKNRDSDKEGVMTTNPEMLKLRLEDIERRLKLHEKELKTEGGFSTAQSVSRHKLELEAALNQGRTEQQKLSALVLKSASSGSSDTLDSQLRELAEDLSNRKLAFPDYGDPFPNPWTPVVPKLPAHEGFVGPREKDKDLDVSDDSIYSNRLSLEEIKLLPKFSSYSPGSPCKTLYVKNLGSGVKDAHLIHLFGRFRVPGDEPISCKLMKGKMSGQAFVTCADIETASRCLHTLCGYRLKGRPMIISYRQAKADKTSDIKPRGTGPS
ncbi:RNA-binding protein 41-like [Watersipora subatra]|uniref:RNA-binding protein 41-like n=1 Tax=Watersipora subatra TaxID=2589382 RepID=UPI00355BE416